MLNKSTKTALCIAALVILGNGCQQTRTARAFVIGPSPSPSPIKQQLSRDASPQLKQMLEGAVEQTKVTTGYDPSYVRLAYPNGDVPSETGVCSDVVVRAFRKAGIDLQKEVHEDMTAAWSVYPKRWGARGTDTSIDHRRVLNLDTYFDRKGKTQPLSTERADYLPGDIVAWELSEGVEHIGIVTNLTLGQEKHYLIVHNIGAGARVEDVLFNWKVIGHYRYFK